MVPIGNRLKKIRDEKGLSQEEISEMLGVKRTTYSKFEIGANNIPVPRLVKIAQKLNVSLNWLLLGNGPKYIKDIGKINFGKFTADVNEMFNTMKKKKSMLHKILGFFYMENGPEEI